MYADRQGWDLQSVRVELEERRDGETRVISQRVWLDGDLTLEQRDRLLGITGRCPVARTLKEGARLEGSLVGAE